MTLQSSGRLRIVDITSAAMQSVATFLFSIVIYKSARGKQADTTEAARRFERAYSTAQEWPGPDWCAFYGVGGQGSVVV